MNIKVNGMNISIEDAPVVIGTEALDYNAIAKESMELDKLSKDIDKSVEAFKIISNVKTMESFGYKATEGVGQAIAKGAKVVKDKIVEWFKRLIAFLRKLRNVIKENLFKRKISRIKDPKAKQKLTGIVENVSKISTITEQKSNDIIVEIDGQQVEATISDDITHTQKNCSTAEQTVKEIFSAADKLADAYLKPVEDELNGSFAKTKASLAELDEIVDKLRATSASYLDDVQHLSDSDFDIKSINEKNPGLIDEMLDILRD